MERHQAVYHFRCAGFCGYLCLFCRVVQLLATSSMDKTVKLWDLTNNLPSCIKSINRKVVSLCSWGERAIWTKQSSKFHLTYLCSLDATKSICCTKNVAITIFTIWSLKGVLFKLCLR